MGDINKLLRETEEKVTSMLRHGGEYSETTNANLFRDSNVYKDLTVGGATVKRAFASATARWFKLSVMNQLVTKVGEKYADKIRELSTQVSNLNKELTGSDVASPTNAEQLRYDGTKEMIMTTLKTHRKMEKKITVIDSMIKKKSEEIFGINMEDSTDDEADDEEGISGEYNITIAKEVETLKIARKNLVREQQALAKDFYVKVSGGLYNADEKGSAQKLVMPTGKVGTSGKMYIAKMLHFLNSQPQKYGWILHEARRILKDFNKRKGTHYNALSENEIDEKLRERFKTCNNALYREFEVHSTGGDFAAAHRPYNYGTNGGSSSDQWVCAEGNGLRILHWFVTRLIKVDCEHIEGIEADLFECPSLFGTGDPRKAVDAVNVMLDEADRVGAQVNYRVILRICDVLSKRHNLFGQLHSDKLKPSAITERRNALPEMFHLMTEVAAILINIGDNEAHWKANQVKVDVSIRACTISVFVEPCRTPGRGIASVNKVEEVMQIADKKRKAEPANDGSRPTCRYDGCTRAAFAHKKERGGELHASKMCFDHFLLGVEDSKLPKPIGVPIKGGKTLVAKRGEDKKWEYKIFNVQLRCHDKLNVLRRNTFLTQIKDEDAEDLLRALRNEMDSHDGMKVYHTEVETEGFNWDDITAEYEGSFELPAANSVMDDAEEIKLFDVKRQRINNEYQNTLFVNERN